MKGKMKGKMKGEMSKIEEKGGKKHLHTLPWNEVL